MSIINVKPGKQNISKMTAIDWDEKLLVIMSINSLLGA